MKKDICLVAALVLLTALMTSCSSFTKDTGVLDSEKLMESVQFKDYDDQFTAMQKEFSDNLTKDKAIMKEEELNKKYSAEHKKIQEFQQEINKQAEAKVKEICEEIARQKNLSVVINKGSVISNGVDITEEVMQKLGGFAPKQEEPQQGQQQGQQPTQGQ